MRYLIGGLSFTCIIDNITEDEAHWLRMHRKKLTEARLKERFPRAVTLDPSLSGKNPTQLIVGDTHS